MPLKRVGLFLLLISPAWGAYNFSRRAVISIPAASGSTTQTNITLYLTMSDGYLATNGNGNGKIQHTTSRNNLSAVPVDFILTSDSTCATLAGSYAWNFTAYSTTAGTATLRILVPSYSAAFTVYACFGDSGTSTWQGGTTDLGSAVQMNWPMNDNTTTKTLTDYSTNARNGTNSVNTSTVTTTGNLDSALSYTASSSNYTSVAAPINMSTTGYYIFSMWYKTPATLPTSAQGIMSAGNSGEDGNTSFSIENLCSAGPTCTLRASNPNTYLNFDTSGFVQPNTWYHLVVFRSKQTSSAQYQYYNGGHFYSNNASISVVDYNSFYYGVAYPAYASGTIDEVQVYNAWPAGATTCASTGACADWVATMYANQSSPPLAAASTNIAIDYSVSCAATTYVGFPGTCTATKTAGNWSAGNTVTISDGSQGGTITSGGDSGTSILTVTPGVVSTFTWTYTPNSTTTPITLTTTNNYSGADPAPTSIAVTVASLSFGGSCAANGYLRTASSSCTVTLNGGTFNGFLSVTISDGGNLGTFVSGGNSAPNSLTVTPASGSTFTFTYNPYLVGAKALTLTNAYGWTNPSALIYTSSRNGDACIMTARAGTDTSPALWASASTWTPSSPASNTCIRTTPDSGDTVIITGYHVQIAASTTAYMGTCPSNNTTYDLQIGQNSSVTSGTLEIAGTLWLCGNVELISAGSLGDNPTTWGIFQIDTGGTLDFDNNQNASVAYRMVSSAEYGWNKLYFGTLGDTCTFSTGTCPTTVKSVNLGAVNPHLYEATVSDALVYRIYGALISDCGASNQGCIEESTSTNSNINNYPDAGVIDIEGNIFLRTGTFQSISGLWAPVANPTIVNNRFLSDLAGVDSLDSSGGSPGPTKTCIYSGNYFSGTFGQGSSLYNGCAFTGNVFAVGPGMASNGSYPYGAFSDNILSLDPAAAGIDFYVTGTNFQRNIWMKTAAGGTGSTHMMAMPASSNWRITDNICLSLGAETEGHCINALNGSSSATFIMLNNLGLPAATNGANAGNGANSGQWDTYATILPNADHLLYFDHNGMFGAANFSWGVAVGHAGPTYPSNQVLQSYRSNVHWAASGTGNFPISNNSMGYGNGPGNSVNTANLGWNAMYNQTASTGFAAGVNSNCNIGGNGSAYLGTPYDICEQYKASPDNTQYDLLNTNPKVIDNTRNPLTWASRVHGGTASLAGMLAVLQGCPSIIWCIEEARTWTARGFQPTNLALKGKAHDGRIVGFAGTYGSGYSGSCSVTVTPQDAADLGTGFAATCSFVSGAPVIQIANPGANYRIATPAAVAIGGTCAGGCVAASLTLVISPHDIGPVQMALIPGAM